MDLGKTWRSQPVHLVPRWPEGTGWWGQAPLRDPLEALNGRHGLLYLRGGALEHQDDHRARLGGRQEALALVAREGLSDVRTGEG